MGYRLKHLSADQRREIAQQLSVPSGYALSPADLKGYATLGMELYEIRAKFDDIVTFAEVEGMLDSFEIAAAHHPVLAAEDDRNSAPGKPRQQVRPRLDLEGGPGRKSDHMKTS